MALAKMISIDRDALLCDLAETYHIYSMRGLPARTLAVLAFGLRADSRIISIMRKSLEEESSAKSQSFESSVDFKTAWKEANRYGH